MTNPYAHPTTLPGAEPFYHPGSGPNASTGCLILHGFGASPDEVRWWGEHLAAEGFTVHGPRLAGHGTHYRDLAHCTWRDWYTSALDGYHLLRATCERVVVGGLSMGAALSLLLAADLPVDGVMALAAPLELPGGGVTPMKRLMSRLRPLYDASDTSDLPERLRAIQRERGESPRGRVRYDTWPTCAILELYTVMDVARHSLPAVTAPTLLVYSAGDRTVPVSNLETARHGLAAAPVEHHRLERSGHILTQDMERETVFALSSAFVARVAGSGS